MDDASLTTALDTDTGVALKPFRRIEVLGGMAGRRRAWTLEQKLALVAEMERCDNVAAFAREREISTALLYTWRRELRYAVEAAKLPPRSEPMFVPVVGEASSPVLHDSVAVEIGGAIVMRPVHGGRRHGHSSLILWAFRREERDVAHRLIGQKGFDFAGRTRSASSLDELGQLIDWGPVAALLDPLYSATKGEPAWPPLAMFKALLLSIWYDLSDVKLAEALDDRASFRRFCGFSANEATPERTAFVRFRRHLVWNSLDRSLFDAVIMQLRSRAVTVKTGTLVDATIIASASEGEDEGRWVKHKGKRAVHGFKAHVGADADTALVEEVSVTSANINDGRAGPDALPDNPGEVSADSAYRGNRFRDAVLAKGGVPRIVATGMWGRDEQETLRKLKEWNQPIHRVRGRIERIFGTWKRSYGLRRMRWRGLAKAAVQVHLTAIAYNLKRTMNILAAQA